MSQPRHHGPRGNALASSAVFVRGAPFLPAVILLLLSGGCGATFHVQQVERELEAGRSPDAYSVYQLKDFPQSDEGTRLLIQLLEHPRVSVRCASVAALGEHLKTQDSKKRYEIMVALVQRLGDSEPAMMKSPVPIPLVGELLPRGISLMGPPRARALCILSIRTHHDFGFDQKAWTRFFAECEKESVPPN